LFAVLCPCGRLRPFAAGVSPIRNLFFFVFFLKASLAFPFLPLPNMPNKSPWRRDGRGVAFEIEVYILVTDPPGGAAASALLFFCVPPPTSEKLVFSPPRFPTPFIVCGFFCFALRNPPAQYSMSVTVSGSCRGFWGRGGIWRWRESLALVCCVVSLQFSVI